MKNVAIVGSGPAALMAADVISSAGAGHAVTVYEKRKSLGRKLLVAGSSGLNITNSLPVSDFARHYSGSDPLWLKRLNDFSPRHWIAFIEKLGIGTFEGTSGRYFVEDMKASRFLSAWNERLKSLGVQFEFDQELIDFSETHGHPAFHFRSGHHCTVDAAVLALGGASWEPTETPLRWPKIFRDRGLGFTDFAASNVGYQVKWPEGFLKEAEGKPLKSINITSSRGSRRGEAMITRYGIEGTPIYFVGAPGSIKIDLKPDLSAQQILEKLRRVKENLSPIRRIKKQLSLCPASFSLVYHCTPKYLLEDPSIEPLSRYLKEFPIVLEKAQPISEAISSSGGLQMSELTEDLMLRRFPGIFAAGEMLDWDAPTGGFLIQGCVSQGYAAGQGVLRYL